MWQEAERAWKRGQRTESALRTFGLLEMEQAVLCRENKITEAARCLRATAVIQELDSKKAGSEARKQGRWELVLREALYDSYFPQRKRLWCPGVCGSRLLSPCPSGSVV